MRRFPVTDRTVAVLQSMRSPGCGPDRVRPVHGQAFPTPPVFISYLRPEEESRSPIAAVPAAVVRTVSSSGPASSRFRRRSRHAAPGCGPGRRPSSGTDAIVSRKPSHCRSARYQQAVPERLQHAAIEIGYPGPEEESRSWPAAFDLAVPSTVSSSGLTLTPATRFVSGPAGGRSPAKGGGPVNFPGCSPSILSRTGSGIRASRNPGDSPAVPAARDVLWSHDHGVRLLALRRSASVSDRPSASPAVSHIRRVPVLLGLHCLPPVARFKHPGTRAFAH